MLLETAVHYDYCPRWDGYNLVRDAQSAAYVWLNAVPEGS